jgi:dephospho-CoA kinase
VPIGARFLLGGGIGSGKTAAAAFFRRLGAGVVSADDVGRAVLESGSAQSAMVLERWPEVATSGGGIDRRRLAGLVFSDPRLLAELEGITHPEIARRVLVEVAGRGEGIVLIELPVLRDLPGEGWPWIVVDAPDEERVRRAVERGPMAEDEVRLVMERQPSRGEWLAAATWVLDNSRDLVALEAECLRVWARLVAG